MAAITRLLLRVGVMLLLCGVLLAGTMIAVGKTLPGGGQLLYGTEDTLILYALDINTLIPFPLINEHVLPFSVVLSPDRAQLAFLIGERFANERHLVVMNVDGTNVRYIDGIFIERPQWLQDSTRLMIPAGYKSVKIINVFDMTTDELDLTIGECHWFNLSPNGQRILFYRFADTTGHCDLYVTDIDGKNLQNIYYDAYPLWSADSQHLLIADGQGIFLIDLDDQLRSMEMIFFTPAYRSPIWATMNWSPDGTQIIFSDDQSLSLYVVSVYPEIGEPTRLDLPLTGNIMGTWSPDGTQIVYSNVGNREIYIANADGTNTRRVTYNNLPELNFLWLP